MTSIFSKSNDNELFQKKCSRCGFTVIVNFDAEQFFGTYIKNNRSYFQSRCYRCRRGHLSPELSLEMNIGDILN